MHFDIDAFKTAISDTLKKYGVIRAALFGSAARGEALEDSDIDILVEFEKGRSLFDMAGLKLELEKLLKRQIDIVTYASLHPSLKKKILSEQVVIQ
jgi:uncharacterized protein